MTDRWLGGTLTNHKVVMSRVKRMQELQAMFEDEASIKLPKKEIAGLKKEKEKLEKVLLGIDGMTKLPSVMVVFDVGHEHIAVREAIRLGIPVVGLVDSNGNPDGIEYVIPGNDDALRSLTLIADICVQAIKESLQATQRGDEAPAAAAKAEDAE
jgi:small subunit ribosomal protein S2